MRCPPGTRSVARSARSPFPARPDTSWPRPRRALALGANTQTVLERLRRKASTPAWDSIVAGVLLQRDAGGDLPNLLRDLAATLETATRQEREAIAATAQARFTARIVLGLPLVAALLAELAKPGLLATLVTNPVSLLLTTFALTFQLVALITMARITRNVTK